VKVYTLTAAERAAFEARTASVRDKVKAKSASVKEIVEIIEKGLADYRSKSKAAAKP